MWHHGLKKGWVSHWGIKPWASIEHHLCTSTVQAVKKRNRRIKAVCWTLQKLSTLWKRGWLLIQKIGKPKQAMSIYHKCKLSSKKMAVFLVASNRILEKLADTQKRILNLQNWAVSGLASEGPEHLSDSPNVLFISSSSSYLQQYQLHPKHSLLSPKMFIRSS